MDILFFILIAIAAIVILRFVFKLIGGCLIKLFLAFLVLAVVGFSVWWFLIR